MLEKLTKSLSVGWVTDALKATMNRDEQKAMIANIRDLVVHSAMALHSECASFQMFFCNSYNYYKILRTFFQHTIKLAPLFVDFTHKHTKHNIIR